MELISLLIIIAAIFIGLDIGANSAANAIGVIVGSNTLSFRKAALIISLSMMLGALLQGGGVIQTIGTGVIPMKECLSDLDCMNSNGGYCNTVNYVCEERGTGRGITPLECDKRLALSALLAALIFVTAATLLAVPVAMSHTIIGAIIGVVVAAGISNRMDVNLLSNIFIAWVSTPIAAIILALVIYRYAVTPLSGRMNLLTFNAVFQVLLILGAVFLSYSIGANNIGNAVGPVIGSNAVNNPIMIILLVGISMGVGVIKFSRGVVDTVGKKITSMGPTMAFTSQLTAGLVIYFFTLLGIPVSATQAVVGSIIGIGLTRGMRTVNIKTIGHILVGWILTPVVAALLSMLVYNILVRV